MAQKTNQSGPDEVVLVHMSDVHFGDDLTGTRAGKMPHQWGHDPVLAQALHRSIIRELTTIGITGRYVSFIVSGDLTRFGDPDEYTVCRTFMEDRSVIPGTSPPEQMGLGLGPAPGSWWRVPGNHDHWGGRPPFPHYPPPAFDPALCGPPHHHFNPMRCKDPLSLKVIPSSGGTFEVELIGIDSNEGLTGTATSWFSGGAHSVASLGILNGIVTSPTKAIPRVRVLVHHHTLDPAAGPQGLDSTSRSQIEHVLHGRVSTVLTGHTHTWGEWPGRVTPAAANGCVEVRCGTTLVPGVSWLKSRWNAIWGKPRKSLGIESSARQGYYIHRIVRTDAGLVWEGRAYLWNQQQGEFEAAPFTGTAPSAGDPMHAFSLPL